MDHKKFLLIVMSVMAFTLHTVCAHGRKGKRHTVCARAAANVVIDRPAKRVTARVAAQKKKVSNKRSTKSCKSSKKITTCRSSRQHVAKKQCKKVGVFRKKQCMASARGQKCSRQRKKKKSMHARRTLATHADYPSNDKMMAIASMFGADIDLKG